MRALLEYHIVNGTHPSATFGLQPMFVPTLLTNPNYTNVTGGQVVELTSLNNQPTVVSGVKAASHLVEAVSLSQLVCGAAVLIRAGHLLPWRSHSCHRFGADDTNFLPCNYNQGRTDRPGGASQQGRIFNSQFAGGDDCKLACRPDGLRSKLVSVLGGLYGMGRSFKHRSTVNSTIQHIPGPCHILIGF